MEELEALVFFRTPSSTGWSGIERRPVGPIQRPIPCDVGLLFDRPSTCDALKSRLWDVTAGELHVGSKLACFFFSSRDFQAMSFREGRYRHLGMLNCLDVILEFQPQRASFLV